MNDPLLELFPPPPVDDQAERAAHYRGWTLLRRRMRGEKRVARGLWLAVPVVAALAVVVVVVTRGDGSRVTGDGARPVAPQSLLDRAALAAARSNAPGALGRGDYLYVFALSSEPMRVRHGDYRIIVRYTDESWTARDGSGRTRHHILFPAFPTPADRAAYRRAGSPTYRQMLGNYGPITANSNDRVPAHPEHAFPGGDRDRVSYQRVRGLRAADLRGDPPEVLQEVAELLVAAPLDGEQRAALFRLAKSLPGVRVAPGATVSIDDGRKSTTVYFNPVEGTVTRVRLTAGSLASDREYESHVVHRPFRP